MALALTQREKNLLGACIAALVLMATFIILKQFLDRRTAALAKISALEAEKQENEGYLADRDFWDKRARWLRETMPTTESLGTAQAQLLEEIQNVALDYELQFQKQPVLLPESKDSKDNAAASLQSPEKFQAIKQVEIELDAKAKEKTPQVLCNLVLARWFKPDTGL
jgi:hypothetical protein